MSAQTRQIKFILNLISQPSSFLFWLSIRFFSALCPLVTIYLFSQIVSSLETKTSLDQILFWFIILIFVRFVEYFTTSLSVSSLDFIISNTQFNIHNFLLSGLKVSDKSLRHAAIQPIRNFADAVHYALDLFRQPGIDSFVYLIFIPSILFILDFKVFIIVIAYLLVHYFVDYYTTQHYRHLKNLQDARTENYYATLNETNHLENEEKFYTYQFNKLCFWNFKESLVLQFIHLVFYALVLFYLISTVVSGQKHLSDLVLIIGYLTSTQTLLDNFSLIKDRLTDVKIALTRLTRSHTVSSVNLDDLI